MSMVHVSTQTGNLTFGAVTFSNIPQDAKHLVVKGFLASTYSTNANLYGRLNDTHTSKYSTGSIASSTFNDQLSGLNITNQDYAWFGYVGCPNNNASSRSIFELWIPNYTYTGAKSMHFRHGRWDDGGLRFGVVTWNVEEAVTKVNLQVDNGLIPTDSTLSLYKVYA